MIVRVSRVDRDTISLRSRCRGAAAANGPAADTVVVTRWNRAGSGTGAAGVASKVRACNRVFLEKRFYDRVEESALQPQSVADVRERLGLPKNDPCGAVEDDAVCAVDLRGRPEHERTARGSSENYAVFHVCSSDGSNHEGVRSVKNHASVIEISFRVQREGIESVALKAGREVFNCRTPKDEYIGRGRKHVNPDPCRA